MSKQLAAYKQKASKQSSVPSRAMSYQLRYLDNLTPDAPASTMIRIRIVRKFQDYLVNDSTKFGIGYIFVDEKGNFMQAKLTPYYEDTFKHRLQEQGIYELSNFTVHPRPSVYNTVRHNCLITFKNGTQIHSIKKGVFNLPTAKPFEFVEFGAMPSMVKIDYLIDVVGFITSFTTMKLMGGKSNKKARNLILQDKSGATMKASLWEEQGELFDISKIEERSVLVLSSVVLGEYGGEVSLGSTSSTLIFYDPDIPEVRALKESGAVVNMAHAKGEDEVQFVAWQDYNKKTLQEIAIEFTEDMKKGVSFSCDCVITAFIKKWSYLACEKCLCKVEENYRGVYTCRECKVAKKTFRSYNATVEISDHTMSFEATIFSKALETYFDFDIYDIPNLAYMKIDLDHLFKNKLEGLEGTFQITMTSRDKRMTFAISKYAAAEDNEDIQYAIGDGVVEEGQLEESGSDSDGREGKKRRMDMAPAEASDPSLKVATPVKKESRIAGKVPRKTKSASLADGGLVDVEINEAHGEDIAIIADAGNESESDGDIITLEGSEEGGHSNTFKGKSGEKTIIGTKLHIV